jgi:lycopene cyclase domain-containing protein
MSTSSHAPRARKLSYAGVLAGCLGTALPLEPLFGLRVLARPRRLAVALAPVLAAFAAADVAAFRAGWWSVDPDQTTGAMLPGGLPAEEAAFFVVIPTVGVLTLEAVKARALRALWSGG